MKPFAVYQYLDGDIMTDRDKREVNSKFWNKGKWENFVLPFLPKEKEILNEMVFVDMGCNAGLFLKMAEDLGFGKVIGVDISEEAINRGIKWRDEHNYHYQMLLLRMQHCIDTLPLADYTVLANAHYYFTINDWIDYLDRLPYKTRYCVIVTAEKRVRQFCWASADIDDIRIYFKGWKEVGFVDLLPTDGDPAPRRLWGLCFESPYLERVPIDSIVTRNTEACNFFGEIDRGVEYKNTNYYDYSRKYRQRSRWSDGRLNRWFRDRIGVYNDVKTNGLTRPIYVNEDNVIVDGNHRYGMMKNFGRKSIFIRRTA